MNTVRLFYTLVLLFSVPTAILLIVYAYRRRAIPGADYFIAIMVCAIFYNITYIGEINSDSISMAMLWFDLEHIPIPIQHYLWLVMSLEYVRIPKRQLRLFKYAMLYHPVAYILIYYTNPIHQLYISSVNFQSNGYFPVLYTVKGPLFMLMVLSGTLIGIISTAYYIHGFMKAPRLQRGGYIIMVIASLFPWSAVYINAANLSSLGIDYFPVFCAVSGVLYAFGMFRYNIFNAIPIATEIVFRKSKEGVMLIDRSDQIIDVNDTFLGLYPELNHLSRKYNFSSFIQMHQEFAGLGGENVRIQYQRDADGETRYFSAEIKEITTEDGQILIGRIFTIDDITLFVEHQKRLEDIASNALNRAESNELSFLQAQIKPHFLNNTLSVIASMITRSPEDAKTLITELGEHLANCYYFDSSSQMIPLEKELESVKTYVYIEKARFRERLNFHLVCEDIPKISIPRLVIQPLVENAIRHGILKKAGVGNVWLIISGDEERIRFEVKDDGTGMSEDVIKRLLCDTGSMRSIGISNINKRLFKYYGEGLQITCSPGQGTQVIFRVPLDKTVDGRTQI